MLDWPVRTGTAPRSRRLAAPFAERRSAAAPLRGLGLAGRVLVVTIGFVLLAMALFYVARLAAFRETWLHNKLASAETVVQAFDAGGATELPPELARKILASVGVKSIAISTAVGGRVLAIPGEPLDTARDGQSRQRDVPRQRQPRFRHAVRQTGNGHSGVGRVVAR